MRKYRAWHPDWGEFVYSNNETIFDKRAFIPFYFDVGFSYYPQDDKWVITEYIQTVNNYEIYLGDIVKAYKHGDKESDPFIYEITEHNATYWFGNWTWIEFLEKFRYVEVIGNKFDNVDLLGGE